MRLDKIQYRKLRRYKYQTLESYQVQTKLKKDAKNGFIKLSEDGLLEIKGRYAWDGPSGPTFDTKNFMRASLVHDALYQLMRENKLDHKTDRKTVDQIFRQMCREDGMSRLRATYSYFGVRWFGISSAKPLSNITDEINDTV